MGRYWMKEQYSTVYGVSRDACSGKSGGVRLEWTGVAVERLMAVAKTGVVNGEPYEMVNRLVS